MKAIQTFILSLGIAAAAHAQVVVTNPISDALAEVNHLEDVAKSIEMINNQVQQINALTQQLQQITAYVQAFGDPAKLLSIIGVDGLIQSLETSGVGHTLAELQELANGVEALRGNANGLYQSISETIRTPSGFELPRAEELYRKFAASDRAAQNFEFVFDDVIQRRLMLKGRIAQTTQQLQAATTDAETQKLSGVIAGFNAELAAIDILASAIVFYAYLVQKFVLYLGYALSPIFIGFLAVRTLQSIGVSYLLGLIGVMLWPFGWGVASIMTKGLIDFMSDQSFLSGGSLAGAAGYTLQNLIGVGILGIWLIFSTIAAPVILQKAIASGTQIGQALASGAATAGVAAAATGANTAATLASGGGAPAVAAGILGGAAAGGVALAGASMSGSTYSPSGSLLSSLASQRKPSRPAKSDLSGDQAVRELLKRN